MKRFSIVFFVSILAIEGISQSSLNHEDFMNQVSLSHPIAKQAQLIKRRGQLELSASRGFFDPKLVSDFSTKDFDEKNYYDLWNTYLSIPTALNVDFKVGYEKNSGYYLNPENNVPGSGLYYAGVSVPLGSGLFINERTLALRQGKLTKEQLENEASQVYNNLLLDANYTFWQWNASYQKVILFQEARDLAITRYNAIKEAVLAGDEAPIDSVEITIQVQQYLNDLAKAQAEFLNYSLVLQNMLWADSVDQDINPIDSINLAIQDLAFYEDYALNNHPDLRALRIKSGQLDISRKFAAEQIKPDLNLNYNFLFTERDEQVSSPGFLENNYKAGVSFSIPILLRKERAKLSMAKVKISENDFKLSLKSREVANKVRAAFNQVMTYQTMIDNQRAAVENYRKMLDGERSKFRNGESSVFYVNVRQNKLVSSQLKLIELEATYRSYLGTLLWSSGYYQGYPGVNDITE